MDLACFRTLDSIVRAQAVFGLRQFAVITRRYHSYRAVFLGRKLGLKVVVYIAPATTDGGYGARNPPREILARVKRSLICSCPIPNRNSSASQRKSIWQRTQRIPEIGRAQV